MTEGTPLVQRDRARHIDRRTSFLARQYNLSESQSEALAWNELGYSASGISEMMDTTSSTAKKYLRQIETEVGTAALAASPPIPEPEDDLPGRWSG